MPTPFRPTRFKLAHGGLLAFTLLAGGSVAWDCCRHGGRVAWGFATVVVACFAASYSLVSLWLLPLLDPRPERSRIEVPFGPKRLKRMLALLDFFPEDTPPGWTEPVNPKGTTTWVAFSGGVAIMTWLVDYDMGYCLHVALAARDGSSLDEARVAEILAHFRRVGPFMEVDYSPDLIRERFPNARTWMALPFATIEKWSVPTRAPAILETPLNEHLLAVRRHLPTTLPDFWSVPLAVTEAQENYTGGFWLIKDDDAAFIVTLVGSLGRAKLCVTIFLPDGKPVNEWRAHDILEHFRGISEFVQQEDDGSIPGGRTFVGEIEATARASMLS